jgi:hypothetical protein
MAVPLLGEADEAALAGRGGAEAAGTAGRESESTVSDLLGEGCRANSFPGSTRVLKDDGTSVPIQSVRVGDTIEATDPLTGVAKPEKVQAVIRTLTDTDFTDLTIAGGVGADPIVTSTQHHPYWDVTRHRWLDAADIHPGDTLRTPHGPAVHVTRVRNYTGHIVTYNLTVSELHTYYVLAGDAPVLVHNGNGSCGIGRELIGDETSDHILDEHRYPGAAGKDAFPEEWSDDQILDAVADVVTSPNSQRTWYKGSAVHAERTLRTRKGEPAVQNVVGTVGGVRILVRYEPLTGKVLTAFPH